MTKIIKLYAYVLSNPGTTLPFRDFERLLAAFGFTLIRTVGSHRQYAHPKVPRPLPVQSKGKDAKPYQLRQLLAIVEEHELGLTE